MYIIKQLPEDFIVRENISLKVKNKGKYAYFILKKRKWTTVKAVDTLAKRLRCNPKQFSVAGMKDYNAVTYQHLSAHDLTPSRVGGIRIKDIGLKFLGYGNEKIRIGTASSNSFTITVRNLGKPFKDIPGINFPNYYGPQRFGGDFRPNTHIIGKYLDRKDYDSALKHFIAKPFSTETEDQIKARKFAENNWGEWSLILEKFPKHLVNERKVLSYLIKKPDDIKGAFNSLPRQLLTLFIQAHESMLWNMELSEFVLSNCGRTKDINSLAYPIGGMSQYLDFKIPLNKEKGIVRKAFIGVSLKYGKTSKDDLNKGMLKQVIKFSLPAGSYATVLLDALYALQ